MRKRHVFALALTIPALCLSAYSNGEPNEAPERLRLQKPSPAQKAAQDRSDGSLVTLILYRPGPLHVAPPRTGLCSQLRTPKREEPLFLLGMEPRDTDQRPFQASVSCRTSQEPAILAALRRSRLPPPPRPYCCPAPSTHPPLPSHTNAPPASHGGSWCYTINAPE